MSTYDTRTHTWGVTIVVVALIVLLAAAPWIVWGYDNYLDWQWCVTHDQGPQAIDGVLQDQWFLYDVKCNKP